MYWSVLEVFDYREYDALNVNGRVVDDVGAFIGYSSICFALKGAKKVIAIEPDPKAYKELLENIKLNNLENTIVPVNAFLVSNSSNPCNNSTISLSEVISKYNIGNNAVLKMDCEGCEYGIILDNYIKTFKEIIFEYHASKNKPLTTLLKTLSRDYHCEITYDRKSLKIIHCIRKFLHYHK